MDEDENIKVIGVILRLPGVFMLELLYMEALTLKNIIGFNDILNIDFVLYVIAWLLVVLPIKLLIKVYKNCIAAGCLVASHCVFYKLLIQSQVIVHMDDYGNLTPSPTWNGSWLLLVTNSRKNTETCITTILLQTSLALLTYKLWDRKPPFVGVVMWPILSWLTGYFQPSVLVVLLQTMSYFALAGLLFCLFNSLVILRNHLRQFLLKCRMVITIFGWQAMLTWAREEYQIQHLLVTCWLLRYFIQAYTNIHQQLNISNLNTDLFNHINVKVVNWKNAHIVTTMFMAAVQCMTTTINLFGFVCIVKEVIKLQYFIIRSWLHCSFHNHPPDPVSDPLTGTIDGITFLIMSLYTDILNTDLEGRFLILIYILFTIASSQFQSIFNIIDPILMTLATAHNGTFWKHLRTVMLATVLLFISGVLSYISFFTMSSTFWVFIIAYNYVNTFSLMLGSMSIYLVLMIDYHTLRGWQSLDDVMFYIRGACRAVEFIVTLCMCGYIMMTFYMEMTSAAGIVMLAAYTYYCIVQRGGKGWKIWMMRRQASCKVQSLPRATKEDLRNKSDLCPICYQMMESEVRVMHCKHYFHENCLKKWFYIQDKCPLCYAQFQSVAF
nr:RING finger protein 145 [Ciona intestinalis]|eukprot:XP_002124302.3 RING finger protein 145 [Ciona intestinalis]